MTTKTDRSRILLECVQIVLFFSLLLWITSPHGYGDTSDYADNIAAAFEYGPMTASSGLWEFGHLLWRPLGWLATWTVLPAAQAANDAPTSLFAIRSLVALNIIAALASIIFWYLMARSIIGSRLFAFVITLGLAAGNAFLNYAHTGSSYVFGLAFISLAVWLSFRAAEKGQLTLATACGCGLSIGLATAVWFPLILAAPACVLTAIIWKNSQGISAFLKKESLLYIGVAAISCLAILAPAYATAASVLNFQTIHEFTTWAVDSGHGWSQSSTVMRMASGAPRLLYDMGWDGLIWKRYLFHDPYAPVSVGELVCCASLWKIGLFWFAGLGLLLLLAPFRKARPALLLAVIAAAPVVWFAVFVMEPSSPERFLSLYPHLVLLLSVACTLEGRLRQPVRIAITVFLASVLIVSVAAMWKPSVDAQYDHAAERIQEIQARIGERGIIVFLSGRDSAVLLKRQRPFHPLNGKLRMGSPILINPGTDQVTYWQQEFAERVLRAWEQDEEVWMSKRVLAAEPEPDWLWVEGDDPRVKWADLGPFFEPLDRTEELGGPDGFFLVNDTPGNRQRLVQAAASPATAH